MSFNLLPNKNGERWLFSGGKENWYKSIGYGARIFLIVILVILLLAGGLSVWRFIFPITDKQINKPHVTVLPGAKVDKIDQSNIQILMQEKTWNINAGIAVGDWGGQRGALAGVWGGFKF